MTDVLQQQQLESGDHVESIKNVLTYLKLSDNLNDVVLSKGTMMKDLKLKSGELQGFNPIITEFCAKNPSCSKLVGRSPSQRALVHQWLEYNLLYLVDAPSISLSILKELNSAVANSAYFAGSYLTIADIMLYHSIYPAMKQMSFYDKEKLSNLSRWFRLIQEDESLRRNNKKIIFSLVPLYSGVSHN